jgi:hypothetical protein
MASLLSFVYRSSDQDADAPRSQFLPPGVSSSGSSESAWVAPQFSSQDESEDTTFVVDETEQWLSSPFTPEGLLPRKSVDSMRHDLKLDIPPRALEHVMMVKAGHGEEGLSAVAKILAKTDARGHHTHSMTSPMSNKNRRIYNDDEEYDDSDDNMILPPPQYNLRSKSTFESSVQSPPISTSSFYSKHSSSNSRPVAMSPVLQVGHARTAVGALVALREAANRHPNASMALVVTNLDGMLPTQLEKNTVMESHKSATKCHAFSMSVLPPLKADFDNDDYNGVGAEKEDSFSQEDDENENAPYQSYASNVSTPNRRRSVTGKTSLLLDGTVSQTGMITQLHSHQVVSAVDSDSSPTFSRSRLSSMGQTAEEQLSEDKVSAPESAIHSVAIASLDDTKCLAYEEDEDDFDRALMERKFRNQQMRKKQVVQEEPVCGDDYFENEFADHLYKDEHDEYGDEGYECNSSFVEENTADKEIDAKYSAERKTRCFVAKYETNGTKRKGCCSK